MQLVEHFVALLIDSCSKVRCCLSAKKDSRQKFWKVGTPTAPHISRPRSAYLCQMSPRLTPAETDRAITRENRSVRSKINFKVGGKEKIISARPRGALCRQREENGM